MPGAAADVTAWPEFHNGVAAGVRLAPGGGGLTRTWVVYNKPKTPNYTHAGMLMGLGLAGAWWLKCFSFIMKCNLLNCGVLCRKEAIVE